jgi:hypothetical protein
MKDKSEIENKRVISRYAIEGKMNQTRQKGVPVAGRRKVKYYISVRTSKWISTKRTMQPVFRYRSFNRLGYYF